MHNVELKIIHIREIEKHYSYILGQISPIRREAMDKYIKKNDQLLSLGSAYLLHKYFSNKEIIISKSNKPYIEGSSYFNISHSHEYVVLAISDNIREVGVDIEHINEKKIPAIKYVLNDEDAEDINELFGLWTSKESLIKCESTGIQDIKIAPGFPLNGKKIFKGENYFTKTMMFNDYSISITLKGIDNFNVSISNEIIKEI